MLAERWSCRLTHVIMTEDERSIANRLANEEKKSEDDVGRTSTKAAKTDEQKLSERDLTAKMHSNAPSKGAKIDKSPMKKQRYSPRRMRGNEQHSPSISIAWRSMATSKMERWLIAVGQDEENRCQFMKSIFRAETTTKASSATFASTTQMVRMPQSTLLVVNPNQRNLRT